MGKVLPPLVLGGEYLVGEPRGDRSTEGRNHHGPRGACSDKAAEPHVAGRGGDAPLKHAGQQPVERQRRRRVRLPATRCHHRLQAVKAARACAAWHPGGGGSGSERALLAAVPLPLELQRPEVLPRQLQQLAPLLPYAHALHQRERRKATLGALTAGCLTVGEAGVGVGSGPDGGARRVLGVAAVGAHAVQYRAPHAAHAAEACALGTRRVCTRHASRCRVAQLRAVLEHQGGR